MADHDIGPPPRACQVCGVLFARYSTKRDAGRCCSRECGFELLRVERGQRRRALEIKRELERWGLRAKKRRQQVERKLQARQAPASRRLCLTCGDPAPRHKRRCDPCAVQAQTQARARARAKARGSESRRRAKRIYKSRRRAIERGVQAERIDPVEVFGRDGWRCHLCGCRTPKRLRGTCEDQAPEIDHIVPLAAGGTHVRSNVACACRRCNGLKGARPRGQLLLIP